MSLTTSGFLRTAGAVAAAASLFVVVSSATVVGSLAIRYGAEIREHLDHVAALRDEAPPLATEVFDVHGEKIGEYAAERRYQVRVKDLPEHVVRAFLSAEDAGFYRHFGLDPLAIVRSALANLRGGGIKQGASTITQQVARLSFLDQSKTWERKAKEAMLAVALEQVLSKDEILEIYLNKIYLGNRSYGLEAAARNYFRKSASDLSVGEAALVAGLPQSPSRYAPNKHPKAASARQAFVLRRMEADGALAKGDAAAWAKRPVHVASTVEDHQEAAPYFVAAARQELARKFEFDKLPEEGLRIRTTLDGRLQRAAATELARAVAAARKSSEAAQEKGAKLERARIEGALVTIDPRTGAVLAMQGGERFTASQFNRASAARRRIGGLMVPLTVSLAVSRGYTLANHIGDDPFQGNASKKAVRGPETPSLYDVVVRGLTLEAAPLYIALGNGTMRGHVTRLGLGFDEADDGVALALGLGTATPLELASAYAAFVNSGRAPLPHLVERVEDRDGNVLYENRVSATGEAAVAPAAAFITWQALKDAVARGHAEGAAGVAAAVAGASAATDDLHNAWFVGLTSTAASAVWIGAETGRTRLAASASAAADLAEAAWASYMKAAPRAYRENARPPRPPAGVAYAPVSVDGTARAHMLPFVSGTEPAKDVRRF
jgi:penicillin-binding protein 1A